MTVTAGIGVVGRRRYPASVGFNPFREQRHGVFDVAMVVVAVAVTLALVAWGFFGG